MISSRTPEGSPSHCAVCGNQLAMESSVVPMRDAPCPHCGCLLWFQESGTTSFRIPTTDADPDWAQLFDWAGRGKPRRLRLDLSDVKILTSALLGRLWMVFKNAEQSGSRVVLCNVDPGFKEVFFVARLVQPFDFDP